MIAHDDPRELAGVAAATPRPLLLGLDIDGVLAPIVAHAADAVLLDGVSEALARLAGYDDVEVAVVSGRTLDDISRFDLPPAVHVVGSHGLESRDAPAGPLDAEEAVRFDALVGLAAHAVNEAGPGAWVEMKATSVAVHIREAAPGRGDAALTRLASAAEEVAGAHLKEGNRVLELLARPASKGTALVRLAAETAAATSVFVGDDVTDEDAFAVLGPDDVSIKVGDDDTIARHRLADPDAVLEWLQALATFCDRRRAD